MQRLIAGLVQTCVALAMVVLVVMPTVPARGLGQNAGPYDPYDPQSPLYDKDHGVKMGVSSDFCDNGKILIGVDWDPKSTKEITCYPEEYSKLRFDQEPLIVTEEQKNESVQHICFPEEIHYESTLPLSGNHRPLWPKFGEYMYLPPQRWLHALEHGAIVLLYHPCVEEDGLTTELVGLLRHCLWKHASSPYRQIPYNMPYALLAYGRAVVFGGGDPDDLTLMAWSFIKEYALKASETHEQRDGQYWAGLLEPSIADMPRDMVTCQ